MKENKDISHFSVPEGYFADFEDNLFSKLQEEKFPQSTGFKVPELYFESLEERILPKILPEKKDVKVFKLYPSKYIAYAAAIAAILLIGIIIFKNPEINALDKIDLATIDKYINEGSLDLNIYEVYEFLQDQDVSQISITDMDFSDTMLEEYILENMD